MSCTLMLKFCSVHRTWARQLQAGDGLGTPVGWITVAEEHAGDSAGGDMWGSQKLRCCFLFFFAQTINALITSKAGIGCHTASSGAATWDSGVQRWGSPTQSGGTHDTSGHHACPPPAKEPEMLSSPSDAGVVFPGGAQGHAGPDLGRWASWGTCLAPCSRVSLGIGLGWRGGRGDPVTLLQVHGTWRRGRGPMPRTWGGTPGNPGGCARRPRGYQLTSLSSRVSPSLGL